MNLKQNKTKITQCNDNSNFNMKIIKVILVWKMLVQGTCLLPIVGLLVC